jgi:NADP-dependent 3-hydroxy acid dehydrogenase YdfG
MGIREPSPRTVAITGGGSGLGREIAIKLAGKGYRVFGTGLAEAEIGDLAAASDGRISLSLTDITDEDAYADGFNMSPMRWAHPVTRSD